MVFALTPDHIQRILGYPQMLGKTPTEKRVFRDLVRGRTKRPQAKTFDLLMRRLSEGFGVPNSEFDILEVAKSIPDGPPWETSIASWNAGVIAAGGPEMKLFGGEAIRLEQLANLARREFARGQFKAAVDHILHWGVSDFPNLRHIVERIDCYSTKEQFIRTALPIMISSTLYLLAFFDADYFVGKASPNLGPLMPRRENGKILRPMRCFLEVVKADKKIRSVRALSDFLLAPRTAGEDLDTLRSLFKTWWYNGEYPAWSRVPHIIASTIGVVGEQNQIQAKGVYIAIALVRLLDWLLSVGEKIQQEQLEWFDPVAVFSDYPAMYARAQKEKAALGL